MRGWALGDVRQADAVSLCLLEGLPQVPEDIRVVLGRGEVAGVDSQGVEPISQHGFPCGLRHQPPRRLEAEVLHRPLAGPMDQALEGGLCPSPLLQLPELRVGPLPPPLSLGGAAVLGGRVGMGGCDGVVGTGGGGGSGGFLVVLCPGGCAGTGGASGCGLAGMRARSRPQGWIGTRGGGGSGACAVCGLTSRVGRGAGTLLVDPSVVLVRSGAVCGPGVRALRGGGRGASRFVRGGLRHEGAGGGVGDSGGAPCWALLPPGLGWLGLNVQEDVLRGWGSRCRPGAGLGLGLGFGCGLRPRRTDGFGRLLGGGLGFWRGCGRGPRRGVGLGGGGFACGGDGFGGPFGRFPSRFGGWSAG